jgi:hypothetical protein
MIAPLTRLILAASLITLTRTPALTYNAGVAQNLKTNHAAGSATARDSGGDWGSTASAASNNASADANNGDETSNVPIGSTPDHRMMSGHDMMDHDMSAPGTDATDSMSHEHMGMSAHMAWSHPRAPNEADQERAAQLVATLKTVLAKYKDYHVAEQDGFEPFHPEFKQPMVHFTNYRYGFKAAFMFDQAEPTSLLYKPLPNGGYDLIGAMYTAPRWMSEDRINERVPLSVARWHRHVDLCFPPKAEMKDANWSEFGFRGSIATKAACDAAGGRFYPQVFGWMVHVYPFESDPAKIWAH